MSQLRKVEFQAGPGVGNPFICTLLYAIELPQNESIKRALHYQIMAQFNAKNILQDELIGVNQRTTIDNYFKDEKDRQPNLTVYQTSIKLVNEENEQISKFKALIHTNEQMGQFDEKFATEEIIITVASNAKPYQFVSVNF